MGVPRYVPMWSMVGIPNIPATYSFIRLGVLGENHNLNLVTLMSWSEESQKFCKILHKFLQRKINARGVYLSPKIYRVDKFTTNDLFQLD